MKDAIVQVETPSGAKLLRQKAKKVDHKDLASKAFKALVTKMKKALAREEYGVAIAAPQVGSPVRVFVVAGRVFDDESKSETQAPQPPAKDRVFINPELTRLSRKKTQMSEGCLSVRGRYGSVLRHERATVRALDEHGRPFTYHGAGLIAQIFQHEVEHLEGILFTDNALRVWEDPELEK
jgi:peptide deformylase